ncbi:ABC transporter ATP-binding protein [Pelagicoccus sp. SDUM812003]|uniref:ABC transporter ATP-binding protein n=1 Tax=Pelagicoccus sp. SDUM812003 TaxID=3041267 RepID=UPI00280FFF45|nr:ABC transporter ATP-binding protein [Pelagicoccus sp. SDUM812003]MDQ8203137.1 ABC transporter ATP-binding protein [Pelagicoccus sp. SDUM812003]
MRDELRGNLSARELTVGYAKKGGGSHVVSQPLNLELRQGEFVCLLGPNGVGKSTLIRTLAGIQSPISGCIEIAGTNTRDLSPRQRARSISVVLTDNAPSGMFTAYSVVALGRHPHTSWTGSLSQGDRDRIEWALKAVDAESLADRQVGELSDGERQKVMIARALAQEASVMLLDEPTAFLDLPRRVDLMRTLRDLARRENLSILLSTHDLDLALRSADKLWLLTKEGDIQTGEPEQLAMDGRMATVFASDELDWDADHGSFRMHRHACSAISLKGEGMATIWTRRALTRIGYEVVELDSCQGLQVEVVGDADAASWIVRRGKSEKHCFDLAALISYLKTLPHAAGSDKKVLNT